ncbi:EbhA [Vagococcus sp. DIV0080]|uniref:EbhA n=1 Tax=Candidatus Vagococcus giribetii TaxID=2230876 RepID=A0ABS3HYN0_9ENTE|nr:EbhA [Vagococcus sp. DIV0080]MBO0477921.1 EbhA [Vagococcus sp. DIV0080]
MKKKSIIVSLVLLLMILCGGGYYWYSQIKVPYDNAIKNFQKEANIVKKENSVLDKEIAKGQKVLDSGDKPLNENTFTDLQVAISTANEAKRNIPSPPKKTDQVKVETTKLAATLDYSNETKDLQTAISEADKSIKQLKQVTAPTQDFVILRLKNVDMIQDIMPVTEENDPNGNLNKAGGYTSSIYFSSNLIDQSSVYGKDLIEKGTEAGGCIEVYKTVEEANKRNDYLAGFDGGGILSSGSHTVIGTIVVRTSDKLTATQQKELESKIIESLTKV